MLWLALWEGLATKNGLLHVGLQVDVSCVFCGGGIEDINHLMFSFWIIVDSWNALI